MIVQYFQWECGYRKMIIAHFLDEDGEVVRGIGIDIFNETGCPCLVMINTKFSASTEFQPITQSDFFHLLPIEFKELALFALDFLKGGNA